MRPGPGLPRFRIGPAGLVGAAAHSLASKSPPGHQPLEPVHGLDPQTGQFLAWVAEWLQEFTDLHPEFETATERFATRLARLDDPDD